MKPLNNNVVVQAMEDITRHEGCVDSIYLDSEGLKTFGIGHLVTHDDPEYGWPVGTMIPTSRVDSAFEEDFNEAVKDAQRLVSDLDEHPHDVQRVLINMAFNLGYNRLRGFKKMLKAVNERDYERASEEMKDSKWYHQVRNRGVELVQVMKEVDNGRA